MVTTPGDVVSNYRHIRTVPALFSIAYAIASLFQFGGIPNLELTWISYSLTPDHAMMISLAALVIAFASSETKKFEMYQDWEQAAIAVGPILIVAQQYIPEVADVIANNQPVGGVIAFILALTSWSVAVR